MKWEIGGNASPEIILGLRKAKIYPSGDVRGNDISFTFDFMGKKKFKQTHLKSFYRNKFFMSLFIKKYKHLTEVKRIESYWLTWNKMIESQVIKNGNQYLRININAVENKINEIDEFFNIKIDQSKLGDLGRNKKSFKRQSASNILEQETIIDLKTYYFFINF